MGNKIKIHEIAKKIGVTSKEALEKAKALGIANQKNQKNIRKLNQKKKLKRNQ